MSSATPVGDFGDLVVLIQDEVATIRMLPAGDEQYKRHSGAIPKYFPKHKEIGEALHLLRQDDGGAKKVSPVPVSTMTRTPSSCRSRCNASPISLCLGKYLGMAPEWRLYCSSPAGSIRMVATSSWMRTTRSPKSPTGVALLIG